MDDVINDILGQDARYPKRERRIESARNQPPERKRSNGENRGDENRGQMDDRQNENTDILRRVRNEER